MLKQNKNMSSLYFKGKSAVWNHHLSVPYHTLDKDKKKSFKGESEDENLIIEGDNLLALKALLPKYQGKVKCIYIDPPYNIGNEGWIYNDAVNSPLIKDWIGNVVGKDDLTRHDKWLCMMAPRLKLLRELLTEDGVIFISIDDNEQHNLRSLLDEIFGLEHFVSIFPWRKRTAKSDVPFGVSQDYEWVICYAKNNFLAGIAIERKYYQTPDYPNDKWRLADLTTQKVEADRPNSAFDLVNPKTGKVYKYNPKRLWGITKDTFKDYYKKGKIVFPDDYDFLKITIPAYRVFESEDKAKALKKYKSEEAMKSVSTNLPKEVGMTEEGNKEMIDLFGELVFPFPKPSSLIKYFIDIINDKECIVLDSFVGSGTTAHAVLSKNKEDGGKRKFIIIQLQENIEKNSSAYKMGFRNVIDITAERIKRVIKKEKIKIGFTYYTLGPSIDADSLLSGKLPKYEEFAKYVFYLATGKNHPDEKKIKEKEYFVGKSSNESIYLMYEKNIDSLKKLAITLEWAENTNKKDNSKKIVYAPACFLDDEHLEKFNIQFVSIPYNLFEKK